MKEASVSAAHFMKLLPNPPSASAEWSTFSVHVLEVVPTHFAATFSDHVVTLQETGSFRARQQVGGRSREGACGSGCVGIVPANHAIKWETTRRSPGISRATSLFIPDAFISRVVVQDWDAE